ncbi:MAG: PLP-dependent transferase, partial [Clostridiales bacterium]|nr:PLP-dependent transferase [Clostridiales bacterium]
ANIVVHSTTKYLDGHAVSVGGVVIDGGNFNWDNGKFEEFVVPDQSYHGISYVKTFGRAAYIVKARVQLMRDYGNCLSPFNAFLTNLGLETLHVRMERHCSNAYKLAKWLNDNPNVEWVNYPMLENSKTYSLCQKYLKDGGGGVLTFGIKGGVEAAKKFMNKLKLTSLVVHVGDIRTYVLHPATTTHSQLSDEQQLASGVTKDMIRVSVGIENINDIIADFSQALEL